MRMPKQQEDSYNLMKERIKEHPRMGELFLALTEIKGTFNRSDALARYSHSKASFGFYFSQLSLARVVGYKGKDESGNLLFSINNYTWIDVLREDLLGDLEWRHSGVLPEDKMAL